MLIYASKSLGQLPHWAFERPTLRVVAPKMVTTHQGMRVKSQMLDESSRLQKFLGFFLAGEDAQFTCSDVHVRHGEGWVIDADGDGRWMCQMTLAHGKT